jgi:hypothetical protein
MDQLIYNIPARLAGSYPGRRVVVRAHDPAELVTSLSTLNAEDVLYGQLMSLDVDIAPLADWQQSVPLDLVMTRPADEFPLLYRFSALLDKHQIRVSIPVSAGFANAVRLSLALHFSVKLEVGQPDRELIEELEKVLELYLHRATVSQPVEYFHSTFLSFFHQEPASLWFIQEEDPAQIRFVSDDGEESLTKRLSVWGNSPTPGSPAGQPGWGGTVREDVSFQLQNGNGRRKLEPAATGEKSECDTCEFFDRCGGYFKWPNPDFDCEGVKGLFATLRTAAAELRTDLGRVPVAQGAAQR